jgi:hypothetical protein
MKKIFILAAVASSMALASCSDFLERKPLDFGDEETYYNSASDLKIAANDFYDLLPTNKELWGGLYTQDINSDNQIGANPDNQSHLYRGNKRTLSIDDSNCTWNFKKLRGINFFINKIEGRESEISGATSEVSHYLGEGYFFRAYFYFTRLVDFGDLPIITEMLPDDAETLTAASERSPRNEVARFILEDLDKAVNLLQATAPESGRITKYAALALKSRVALFEATWERYHANTCFVPGNNKWVGKDYHPDFQFKAGSAEAEVNFFLDQAIDASQQVAQAFSLDKDYFGMFNNIETFADDDEVLLARYYKAGVITHSCSAFLKSGGGCGVTRAAVQTFLMANGLPWYANNSGFTTDATSYEELQNRDPRLTGSVRAAGRFINVVQNPTTGRNEADTIYYYKPALTASGNSKATTGYELSKWLAEDDGNTKDGQRVQYYCTTAVPILRAGECYLNYIEAYYERHHNLGGNCDTYWRALRRRAGVDEDYNKTIANTDLSQENDLAVWSKGVEVSPTLYNIRRERRCELIAEGLRLNDLKRWRSLDMMVDYQPEGINLWGGSISSMYSSSDLSSDVVSQAGVSDYIRPLQIKASSLVYDGYNFPKQHYLEPIPLSEFLLTIGSDGKSVLYQNPGWPTNTDGTADYTFDCD